MITMIYPTLRQMQYLIALQDAESFTEAARACSVSQPSLSAGIKELEHILGYAVIDRSKRRVILTPLGQEVAESSRAVLADVGQMLERVQQLSASMSGPLRLGVIPTIAPYFLPGFLPGLQSEYPALELRLYEDLSDRLLEKLRSGQLDLVLMAFPFEAPDLTQTLLFEERFVLAAPEGYLPEKTKVRSEDLDPGELLLLEDGHCLSDHVLKACNIQAPRRRKAYSATSLSTLLQMVKGGYGITLVPEMAVRAGAMPAGVRLVEFKAPTPQRVIGLSWRAGSPRSEDFKTLGRYIKTVHEN